MQQPVFGEYCLPAYEARAEITGLGFVMVMELRKSIQTCEDWSQCL